MSDVDLSRLHYVVFHCVCLYFSIVIFYGVGGIHSLKKLGRYVANLCQIFAVIYLHVFIFLPFHSIYSSHILFFVILEYEM